MSHSTKIFGYSSRVYKAISSVDGCIYAMRRIEGFLLHEEMAMASIDPWTRLQHPNIVSLREAFTTKSFNDDSLIFVFDYHPLSMTLFAQHFAPIGPNAAPLVPVTEPILWSYAVQLCSAVKAIHDANLACRILEPTKILVTDKGRYASISGGWMGGSF